VNWVRGVICVKNPANRRSFFSFSSPLLPQLAWKKMFVLLGLKSIPAEYCGRLKVPPSNPV